MELTIVTFEACTSIAPPFVQHPVCIRDENSEKWREISTEYNRQMKGEIVTVKSAKEELRTVRLPRVVEWTSIAWGVRRKLQVSIVRSN